LRPTQAKKVKIVSETLSQRTSQVWTLVILDIWEIEVDGGCPKLAPGKSKTLPEKQTKGKRAEAVVQVIEPNASPEIELQYCQNKTKKTSKNTKLC
jgi:hypothetical protein